MQRSKEEIIANIQALALDDDSKMALLEDVTDSMEAPAEIDMEAYVEREAYDTAVNDLAEMKAKYIARFGEQTGEDKPKDDIIDNRIIVKEEI